LEAHVAGACVCEHHFSSFFCARFKKREVDLLPPLLSSTSILFEDHSKRWYAETTDGQQVVVLQTLNDSAWRICEASHNIASSHRSDDASAPILRPVSWSPRSSSWTFCAVSDPDLALTERIKENNLFGIPNLRAPPLTTPDPLSAQLATLAQSTDAFFFAVRSILVLLDAAFQAGAVLNIDDSSFFFNGVQPILRIDRPPLLLGLDPIADVTADVPRLGQILAALGPPDGATPAYARLLSYMTPENPAYRVTAPHILLSKLGVALHPDDDIKDPYVAFDAAYDDMVLTNRNFPQSGIGFNNLGCANPPPPASNPLPPSATYFETEMVYDASHLFAAAARLELPFREGAICNLIAARKMTSDWSLYDEDKQTVAPF
jgi:hypothetical protein